MAGNIGYVQPAIRLEFGVKMPVVLYERRVIRPYGAEAGRHQVLGADVLCQYRPPERTFCEKTILMPAQN